MGGIPFITGTWDVLIKSAFQMLVSSGNTLTDKPSYNVLLDIWASHRPIKLTQGIKQYGQILFNQRPVR